MTGRKVDLAEAQWVVLVLLSMFGIVPSPNDDCVGGRAQAFVCVCVCVCVGGWSKKMRNELIPKPQEIMSLC